MDVIKKMGVIGTPIRGDMKFPMVATRDIAKWASQWMMDLNWKGHQVAELLGERDVSYNEIADVMARQLHMDRMKYIEFSYDDMYQGLKEAGLSKSAVENMIELYHAVNDGLVHSNEGRRPENTSWTSIEQFVQEELRHALAA